MKSGNYKQGRTYLFIGKENSFCCLGVFCDLIGTDRVKMEHFSDQRIELVNNSIPEVLKYGSESNLINSLVKMNDYYKNSFIEIAEFLEINLELI